MSLVPFSDEQAGALKELIKLVGGGGSYAARVLGELPEDLVGWLIGDRVRAARYENAARLSARVKEKLKARGIDEPDHVPPSIAAPLLDAAADESRDELVDLWSRLLVNAMDPARSGRIRLRYIDVVKRMDPLDAMILQEVTFVAGLNPPTHRGYFATALGISESEVEVSFNNLAELSLLNTKQNLNYSGTPIGSPGTGVFANVHLTSIGRQFLEAVQP